VPGAPGEKILCLDMCAMNLLNVGNSLPAFGFNGVMMHKSGAYLKFLHLQQDGTRKEVGKTVVISGSLNPIWPTLEVNMNALCLEETDSKFRIECWHSRAGVSGDSADQIGNLIGWVDTSVEKLWLKDPIEVQRLY
jgi:hypothetical protein